MNQKRRYELEPRANEVFLSAMSVAELMIKHSIGKIHIDFNPIEMAEKKRSPSPTPPLRAWTLFPRVITITASVKESRNRDIRRHLSGRDIRSP